VVKGYQTSPFIEFFLQQQNPLLIPPIGGKKSTSSRVFSPPLGEMPRSGKGGLFPKMNHFKRDAAKRQRGD